MNHPEKVDPQTQFKVEVAIQKLGFVRNDAARQLRRGSSTVLGLVLPDLSNPFFLEVARGVAERADAAG
jgi:LacI family transcriptional regulator